jgi:hypothetical protein
MWRLYIYTYVWVCVRWDGLYVRLGFMGIRTLGLGIGYIDIMSGVYGVCCVHSFIIPSVHLFIRAFSSFLCVMCLSFVSFWWRMSPTIDFSLARFEGGANWHDVCVVTETAQNHN